MARLHDLLPLYQVASETLDDSIYFELREYVRDNRVPSRYLSIITGQIREVDEFRSTVGCEQ